MKKSRVVVLLMLVAICVTSLFAFSACSEDKTKSNGTMILVLGTETPVEYEVKLDDIADTSKGLISVLEYVKAKYSVDFSYTGEGDNAYLNKVGALTNDYATQTYLYIYTNVEEDFDVSSYVTTINYKDKILTSSGVGAWNMTIKNGAIIYIGIIVF